MEEKEKAESKISETGEVVTPTENYIEAIKDLKQKTVDRSMYDSVMAENKRLVDALVNGQMPEQKEEVKSVDLNELRKSLFKGDNNNLEYVKKALLLRSELIKNGNRDPFLPCGEKTLPTDTEVETADRVAKVLQECVDNAEGNSEAFTRELMMRTVDTSVVRRK